MNFRNSGIKLNQNDIVQFEDRFHISLPNEYKSFLLSTNGGIPGNVYFIVNNADVVVDVLLSIGTEKNSLEEYFIDMKIRKNYLPANLLPIGVDAFGNIICIDCSKKDVGKIYIWDHEGAGNNDQYSNLRIVSDTFDFFLKNLQKDI